MPDWSYTTLSGGMLRRMGHDRGRRFVNGFFSLMGRLPEGHRVVDMLGHMEPDAELERTLPSGDTLASCLVLMPCIDPRGGGATAFSRFGCGALTFGPVVLADVDEPTFRQGDDHSIVGTGGGALSLADAQAIVDRTGSSEFFFEVDPFDSDDDPVDTVRVLVEGLAVNAAAVVLSPQCFADVLELDEADRDALIAAFVDACRDGGVEPFVGMPLSKKRKRAVSFARACSEAGASIYVSGQRAEGDWRWGGDAQREAAPALTRALREVVSGCLLIDGGVLSPREARELELAGADLIGISAGLVHTGPGLPKRTNEALLYFLQSGRSRQTRPRDPESPVRRPWVWGMLLGLSMLFGAFLAGWTALTSVLLPYDEEFLGKTAEEIAAFNPRVLMFMTHDRITLAGTMVSIGILYTVLSWFAIRRGHHWAQHAVTYSAAVGALSFFAFLGFGYLDPFHAFVTAILLQFLIQVVVRPIGPKVSNTICPRLDNDTIWRSGLWGQLLFVVHGGALILAGTTILMFGMSVVFVPQDIAYLGCSADHIHAFDDQLKSLIAHDRATFGGMLLSAGVALVCTAMWSFRHGDRWLFWTLSVIIFAPYAMTLWIHWDIGYRDHFHLAPVYIGLGLLVVSMALSWRFLLGTSRVRV